MISTTVQYGLRAMVALARLPQGELGCAACIAERAAVPQNYLSKLLQQLTRAGLLVSQKGPHGGFRLARTAGEINLLQIVNALDSPQRLDGCLLGPSSCTPRHPCPAHKGWQEVTQHLQSFLSGTTLATLAAQPAAAAAPRRAPR